MSNKEDENVASDDDSSSRTVGRIAIKLPAFYPAEPDVWFDQADAQFKLAKIKEESTKFYHVVAQLNYEYAREVRDFIKNPPKENMYQKLRQELVKRLSTSREQQMRQLLNHEELGDRKPSQFLRHLRTLAAGGVTDEFLRSMWANRLPQHVQAIIATQSNASLDDVAELADKICEVASPPIHQVASTSSTSSTGGTSSDNFDVLLQKLDVLIAQRVQTELSRQISQLNLRNDRPSRRDDSRSKSRSRGRSKSKTPALVSTSAVGGQRRSSRQQGRGSSAGWDIRLAVPGEPGSDYPTLDAIPKTSFSCAGKAPGYYADYETNCQAFRVCTSGSTYGFQSFLCPNGTLFNQAVFVCDWWMNVNCDSSQQAAPTANPQFGNLRLGPHLMNDIKKMLTHPMRNPYDKTAMRGNLIVMQEYRPPAGQMFANAFSNKLSNVYVPATQLQQPYGPSGNSLGDSFVAGSTPSPLYSTAVLNSDQNSQRDVEVFQRQRQNEQNKVRHNGQTQNGQYVQAHNYQQPNAQQNGHLLSALRQSGKATFSNNQASGKLVQQQSGFTNEQQRPNHNYDNQGNTQYSQQTNQVNLNKHIPQQREQIRHKAQYSNIPANPAKQTEFGISYTNQQYNSHQPQLPLFPSQVASSIGNEAKQNLVSNGLPATVIAKTLTFNRIVNEPKPGGPKSRITFKTWIVKPSKAAKLIAEPTAYTYDRPTTAPQAAKLVASPTPYYYNKPTTTQAAKLVSQPEAYYYNPPTPTKVENLVSQAGYSYNKPTTPEKQVEVTGYSYNKPTTPEKQIISTVPTLPARQYLTPSSAPPTVPSRLYLAATTFKPLARLYIPPSSKPPELSRQYLNPSAQSNYYQQSAKLQASPSTPTPVIVPAPDDKSSYSVTKHSRINTNHNNLTFTDILTKEKLDITVNDIVKDTRNILGTASTQQNDEEEEYPDEENYLTSTAYTESGENLSPATPTVELSKNSRLVVKPASDLEPPEQSFLTGNQNSNRLAALPFYQETNGPTNTIERTVSLKISIPERTAAYLFNASNDSHHDKLEILNTGSSNYLVLTNKLQNTAPSFIPIGKLIVDKNSSISNSQALVFSFLADSINQVKEYKNLAQENHAEDISQSQFQTINSDDLASITDKVAQLTSAQYTTQNNNHLNQLLSTNQHTNAGNLGTNTNNFKQNKNLPSASAQTNVAPQHNTQSAQHFSTQFRGGDSSLNANLRINNEQQLYSGQLYQAPVPVAARIYNGQSSAKLISNNLRQPNTEVDDLHRNTNNNNNNLLKQSSAEVEVVQSHSIPHPAPLPSKLQAPIRQPQSFTSQEDSQSLLGNFVNTGNGISAQLRDKIVGTITHPSQENKVVTYKKDQSYYVFTKVDDIREGLAQNVDSSRYTQNSAQNAKLIQNSNADDTVTLQFIPSVGYQLEDEKEQQKLLNTFNIDEFGIPKQSTGSEYLNANSILTSNVDYTVQHNQDYNRNPNALYVGPSSYSAPQSSVGRLEMQQIVGPYQNSPTAAKLELEDSSKNGYPNVTPARLFTY